MSQITQLNDSISGIKDAINSLGESISTPTAVPDIKSLSLPKEEIAMKILMNGGNSTGIVDDGVKMDEESAYLTVYGELQYDDNGNLLYPGIVNKDKTNLSENHPLYTKIDETKEQVSVAVKQLGSKVTETMESSVQLGVEIVSAVTTIAASATILPFGSGIPVAFSAVMSIFSSLQAFQTKVAQILPVLEPLSSISILLPDDKVDEIITPINGALSTLNGTLQGAEEVVGVIGSFKNALMGTGGGESSSKYPPPGTLGVPTEQVELDISISQPEIFAGEKTKLTAMPSKGTWEYTYEWTSRKIDEDENTNFSSTKQEIIVEPWTTTIYTVNVTDSEGNKKSKDATVKVSWNPDPPHPDPVPLPEDEGENLV